MCAVCPPTCSASSVPITPKTSSHVQYDASGAQPSPSHTGAADANVCARKSRYDDDEDLRSESRRDAGEEPRLPSHGGGEREVTIRMSAVARRSIAVLVIDRSTIARVFVCVCVRTTLACAKSTAYAQSDA